MSELIEKQDIKKYKEQEKKYYEQADELWLLDKIERERKSINHNNRMNQLSRADIEVCEDLIRQLTDSRKCN